MARAKLTGNSDSRHAFHDTDYTLTVLYPLRSLLPSHQKKIKKTSSEQKSHSNGEKEH